MHKHPDADAFMRACLDNPTDTTTRLVFADWLEDTGIPHNTAWAHFIRAKIEADQHAPDSPERRALDYKADWHAQYIRAKLTVCAKVFAAHPGTLLQLLPVENIVVRLNGFKPNLVLKQLFPHQFLAAYNTVPFALVEQTVFLAVNDPRNREQVAADLSALYGLYFVAVLASPTDISHVIAEHFPPSVGRIISVSSALS